MIVIAIIQKNYSGSGLKTNFYLSEMVIGSKFSNPIPVKILASTRKVEIEHWLYMLKRYFTKKRHEKSGQSSCSNTG